MALLSPEYKDRNLTVIFERNMTYTVSGKLVAFDGDTATFEDASLSYDGGKVKTYRRESKIKINLRHLVEIAVTEVPPGDPYGNT